MSEQTPPQTAAMDTESTNVKVKDVEVVLPAGKGYVMPESTKLTHTLATVVAGVVAVAVAVVLADGTSVVKLKDRHELKDITNPAWKDIWKRAGLQANGFRLDELLGPTYGIGLNHDQAGYTWTEIGAEETLSYYIDNLGEDVVAAAVPRVIATDSLKHPVPFLQCDDLQKAGLAAMSLGYIAELVAALMIVFHAAVLIGMVPGKIAKIGTGLVWFVLTAGFLTVVIIAICIYPAKWECKNPVIPEIIVQEHFNYSYGMYFACIGYLSSLLVFSSILGFTSTTDGDKTAVATSGGSKVAAVFGGLFGGITLGAVLVLISLGGTGYFDPPPPVDPDYNPCAGQKPYHAGPGDAYFLNTECMKDGVVKVLEQAGANVTKGYKGLLDAGDRVPITKHYSETDLCPVNVHWHLGAEHLSIGQYDTAGKGPESDHPLSYGRQLAADADKKVDQGYRCHHYDSTDPKFTTPYQWDYCTDMVIGETYEIHWPHSAAGACGTEWQYQTPFYDGVFCNDGIIKITPLNTYNKIGVQGQIFTVVNSDDDDTYYFPDLIKGMIVDEAKGFGQDMAMYTGSTTGQSRDDTTCSRYAPITWQVDRKCHMVSAKTFDKLCKDMKGMKDDMKGDTHPHGARKAAASHLVANNQQSRK